MNNYIALFLFTILSFSCKRKTNFHSKFEKIPKSDTVCLNELANAKIEIANGRLTYCHFTGAPGYWPLRAEIQMDSLLKLYKIEYRNEGSPCVIENNKNYNCYCDYMQEEINNKYGKKSTDSLLYLSDSFYISKRLGDTYEYGNWDNSPQFPGEKVNDPTNHSGLQSAFEKLMPYPVDYHFKSDSNSLALVKINLNIDENGVAKVTDYEFVFYDYKTKESDFNTDIYKKAKDIFLPLIEKTRWTPATIKKMNVKSKNEIFLYLR